MKNSVVNRGVLGGALAGLLLLGATGLLAQPESGEKEKKVEKRQIIVVDADGKTHTFDGKGVNVKRGYLGVSVIELTPELRGHFGVPEGSGVMVSKVATGSPAEKAGIQVGDIITLIDSKAVATQFDIREQIRLKDEGAALPIEIWRGGKRQAVTGVIEKRDLSEVDLAPLLWKTAGDGEVIQIPALKKLATMDWPQVKFKTIQTQRTSREAELEKKLKDLEKRLKALESRLPKT